ncbi:MBL fold metallo-hydrolase [Sphingobium sp. YR768]|uniref:MBL fold metallo-hydrolase n=1 Tax=Sphingobium sp. YR768 TaxID=1884365 RepID=UPI0008C52362|nr:MBL fold metallo-hydrolase [Sphingobium sp. YR768]SES20346.1 metallo-beta-lactamase class B [Sphingobium sp. YR768]
MYRSIIPIGLSLLAAAAGAQPAHDTPAALAEAAKARAIAGDDLKDPLFLCEPHGGGVVRQALETGSKQWLEPARLFDNLYYVGNGFVGVFVRKTSEGLVLFDASQSEAEARDHIVPGLQKLGLDPATIRYVIVTHGHYDHFGGAAWLQRTYGARIALSSADWQLLEKTPADAIERSGTKLPRRDIVITDGQQLILGDTKITLYVTPGHTPGAVSAIVPVLAKGKLYNLSLLGSTAFPASIEPTEKVGGLKAYDASVLRFAKISRAASAQGILNTHVFADGTHGRIEALTATPDQPNPFLKGSRFVGRYYQILHHCLLAAQLRPQADNVWLPK